MSYNLGVCQYVSMCMQMCVHDYTECLVNVLLSNVLIPSVTQTYLRDTVAYIFLSKLIDIITPHLQSGYYFVNDKSMSLTGLVAAPRGCAAPYIQVV